MKQIPLPIAPHGVQNFDSFVPGPNAAALQHLRGLAVPAAPVYLWGGAGTGKTHLLHALVHEWQERGEQVGWFAGGDAAPWELDDAWSLVVLDDCGALDAQQQAAAFSVFVQAAVRQLPVVAAGALPPVDLAVREDLRTRLGWGLVFAMEPLAEPEVRAILRCEADLRGIFLSDDVMDHLLTRFARDLKHLMRLLDRLDDFALSQRRLVTVPLLKQMLAEEGEPQ